MYWLLATLLLVGNAHAQPSWVKKKKTDKANEAAVAADKASEKPMVGPGATLGTPVELGTSQKDVKPSPSLLFTKEGATDSFTLDIGKLNQTEIGGTAFSGQYAFGWWMNSKLIPSFVGRATTVFETTYVFLQVALGLQARYFVTRNLIVGGSAMFAMSQGLSRVPASNIPQPPGAEALGARRGLIFSANAGYLWWSTQKLAVGPYVSYGFGTQDERAQTLLSFGLTLQSGRPNTGDVTVW